MYISHFISSIEFIVARTMSILPIKMSVSLFSLVTDCLVAERSEREWLPCIRHGIFVPRRFCWVTDYRLKARLA